MLTKMRDLIYNLFVKYFLPKHKFVVGENIEDLNGRKYLIEATYYDQNLKPILVARDEQGSLRSFPDRGVERK